MLVLDLMLIGLAVTLDPLPLTAFLIVLPSKRGVRKGAAFVFGWLVSLAIVVAVTITATGNDPPKPATAPSLAALAIKIALGIVLVRIAVRHIRARRQPKPPKKPPKWQAQVDSMSPWFAMALAPALQPWVLIGMGAATVLEAKRPAWAASWRWPCTASWPRRPIWPGAGPGSTPNGPGDHHREPGHRLLVHRRQPLPAGRLMSRCRGLDGRPPGRRSRGAAIRRAPGAGSGA